MRGEYYVYLHFAGESIEPFYVGASSDTKRPYSFVGRSDKWSRVFHKCEGNIRVQLIPVISKQEATRIEAELIVKHSSTICNVKQRGYRGITDVSQELQKIATDFGGRVRLARKRRGLTAIHLAERAGIDRTTLHHIEKGSTGVSFGAYLCVLEALGLHEGIESLLITDPVGHALMDARLVAS